MHLFCHTKQWIMSPNTLTQCRWRNTSFTPTIITQIFFQQITREFPYYFQPHSCIIVLPYIIDLNDSNSICIVHHSQASRPTTSKHIKQTHFFKSAHIYTYFFSLFGYFCIFMIGECKIVIYHKFQLPFQLLR